MANSIYLTRYTLDNKGRLSEKDSKNILTCYVSEVIENKLILNHLFREIDICEEDLDTTYSISYIANENIDDAMASLMAILFENSKLIAENSLSKKEIDEIHNANYFLYNIRNLFLTKKNKYIENSEVLLVFEGNIDKEDVDNG